ARDRSRRRAADAGEAGRDFHRGRVRGRSGRVTGAGLQPRASAQADLLATILAATRRIVDVREQREPRAALEKRAAEIPARTGRFQSALQRVGGVSIVAECKRRSPSRGVLRAEYDPVAIATGYAAAGGAAVS